MAYLDNYLKTRNERLAGKHKANSKKIKPRNIIRGERREHLIESIMDNMVDWRSSPFEQEGAVHHALRSGLCLGGHSWTASNLEAASLLSEVFRLMRAERPKWEEGQRRYVEPRENCKWCGDLLPDDLQRGGSRFMYCSEHCARSAELEFLERTTLRDKKVRSSIDDALRRLRAVPRNCACCQKLFRPRSGTEKLCSVECRAASKIVLPVKICTECGIEFRPRMSRSLLEKGRGKFCSITCKGKSQKSQSFEKTCVHCESQFVARSIAAKYCSKSCTMAAFRGKRKIAAEVIVFPIREPLTAQVFDDWFRLAA